jgi:hypothetical protein
LLWDYNLYDDEDPAPCHCGSPKCRGTMYSEDWIRTLKRRAARRLKRAQAEGISSSGRSCAGAPESARPTVKAPRQIPF